jgi:protein-S-isoprenylcysteine O-methyltransferase Ste14
MSEPASAPRDHSGVWFPPPLIYVLFFAGGVVLDRVAPLPQPPAAVARPLGTALVVGFLALTVASLQHFRAAGTSVVPIRPTTALVVGGPYSISRNPMYLALLLLYSGLSLLFLLVWPLLLGPGVVWIVGEWVIGPEERYLAQKFGDEYHRYRARVRRWL